MARRKPRKYNMKRRINKIINNIKSFENLPFYLLGILIIISALSSAIIPSNYNDAIFYVTINGIAGLGFALLLGYGGLSSLGTGAFFAVGSFGLHYMYKFLNLPILIALIIVIVISILIAILFGLTSLRISGMYLAIVTLALSELVFELIKKIPHVFRDKDTSQLTLNTVYSTGKSGGFLTGFNPKPLAMFGFEIKENLTIIIAAVFLVISIIVVKNLIKSQTGRALLTIKHNENAAQTMGINVIKYRLFAFVISGIMATIAGFLKIIFKSSVDMSFEFGLAFSLNILAGVIVGGMNSVWGIMLGIAIIFGLDLTVFANAGDIGIFINGILIIIVMMFYPAGLIQLFTDIKIWITKLRNKLRKHKYGV